MRTLFRFRDKNNIGRDKRGSEAKTFIRWETNMSFIGENLSRACGIRCLFSWVSRSIVVTKIFSLEPLEAFYKQFRGQIVRNIVSSSETDLQAHILSNVAFSAITSSVRNHKLRFHYLPTSNIMLDGFKCLLR